MLINILILIVLKMAITKEKRWHYDLASFCLGFDPTMVKQYCNTTYLAKKIFSMKMPDDYEREGKHVVSSSAVLRETYLLGMWFDQEKSIFGYLKGVIERYENFNFKSYSIGKLLSSFNEDEQRLAATYLACCGDERKIGAIFDSNEKEKAENVISRLEKASKSLDNPDTKKLKKEFKSSLEEAIKHENSLKRIFEGIETKLQTLFH